MTCSGVNRSENTMRAGVMKITAEEFKRMTGQVPIQDDLARCNCRKAGMHGHNMCGICKTHDKPRFECGCYYEKRSENLSR